MNEVKVRMLIADHLAVPVDRVEDRAAFTALGADSLDLIELTMLLESELGIHISDDESELCTTVGDALAVIRAKYSGARDLLPALDHEVA